MSGVIAIIPARSGSKSISDKNIKLLSGYPLIAYSIAVAKCSLLIDRVIVSTDSKKYAEIAKKFGAEVPFIRPHKYSTDISTDRDFLRHVIHWIKREETNVPEYLVHLRPTTPLRNPVLVDKAIKTIQADPSSTSLRSGHKSTESPMKWFTKDSNGYFKGLCDSGSNSEIYNQPKEKFESVYIPNGYVDVVKSSFIENSALIHGSRMIGFEVPITTEIDSIEEFNYIEYQLKNKNSVLLDYLNKYHN